MVTPVYNFGIEVTSGFFKDFTSRFERGNWGSDIVDMFNAPRPGFGIFELGNDDGLMSPGRNTELVPGRAVRLKAQGPDIVLSTGGRDTGHTGSGHARASFRSESVITGELDVRAKIAPADWTPSASPESHIFSFSNNNSNGWILTITSGGQLKLYAANAATWNLAASSTAATGFVNGSTHWIRVTRTTGGEVKFYTSEDGEIWTQLGATVAGTAGSIASPSGSAVMMINGWGGGSSYFWGKTYYADARKGIDGQIVICFDPTTDARVFDEEFTDSITGIKWTIQNTAPYNRIVPARLEYAGRHDQYFNIPNTVDTDDDYGFIATSSITNCGDVGSAFSLEFWFESPASGTEVVSGAPSMLEKWSVGSGHGGYPYVFRHNVSAKTLQFARYTGSPPGLSKSITPGSILDGYPNHVGLVSNGSLFTMFINGFPVGTTTEHTFGTASVANLSPVYFGIRSAVSENWKGKIRGFRLYPGRTLTASEVWEHYQDRYEDERNLAGHWPLNEGSGLVGFDQVGSGAGNFTVVRSAHFINSATEYPLFFGRIQEISLSPNLGHRVALLSCADEWDRLSRLSYTTSLHLDIFPSSLFTVLMSLSNVRSFNSEIIEDNIELAWFKDHDAPNTLHRLVSGGRYQLNVDGNGTFKLGGRYSSSFDSSVASYDQFDSSRISLSHESIINKIRITSLPREQVTEVTTLAFLGGVLTVPPSGGIGFWLAYQDPRELSLVTPVSSIITPVASTDYYGAGLEDGGGANLTSSLQIQMGLFAASAVVSLFNPGADPIYLTRFQLRGYPLLRLPELSAETNVATSQSRVGLKLFEVQDTLVSNFPFMDSLARVVANEKKDGVARNSLTLTNEWPDILSHNNGNIISTVDSFSGYTAQWQIRGMQHELSLVEGLRHTAQYDMEEISQQPFLVLDHATFGKLDSARILGI
jgi:hypothetical protein